MESYCLLLINYSCEALIMHLSLLFKGMARHKIVPDPFGVGVIIPLLKDKEGDCNSIDNYRGITLCPVISKLFELVIVDSYSHMLTTDDLQFDFKPNLSCDNGLLVLYIFTWRTTVDHFIEHGISVFVASLDVSKAFESVSHTNLTDFLAKKAYHIGFYVC